ncbi:MAG: hypothetical protein FJW79_11310 [Actinobacteria bacterium]|nr:hypothetical protein [Actinomycetota bacterium]
MPPGATTGSRDRAAASRAKAPEHDRAAHSTACSAHVTLALDDAARGVAGVPPGAATGSRDRQPGGSSAL